MLINEYDVTEKKYINWVFENKLSGKKKYFTVFWLLMIPCFAILCFLDSQRYLYVYLIAIVYCLYRGVIRDYIAGKAVYKKRLATNGTDSWHRIIRISSEELVIDDGKVVVNYKNSDIVKTVANEKRIRIFMNDGSSIRLYNDSFVQGKVENYKETLKM